MTTEDEDCLPSRGFGHRKGLCSELKACADLIEQGYEVFKNVCHWGPIDIVAYKDGQFLPIDVKSNANSQLTDKQIEIGVIKLSVDANGRCTLHLREGYLDHLNTSEFIRVTEAERKGLPVKCAKCDRLAAAQQKLKKHQALWDELGFFKNTRLELP